MNRKRNQYLLFFLLLGVLPVPVFAETVQTFLGAVNDSLSSIIPVLMAVAVVVFLYGVVKFISAHGDEEKIKTGKKAMMYGLVGLFVFLAFWGLVNVLASTFNVGQSTSVGPPNIPGW